jgi:hypothetical protein
VGRDTHHCREVERDRQTDRARQTERVRERGREREAEGRMRVAQGIQYLSRGGGQPVRNRVWM